MLLAEALTYLPPKKRLYAVPVRGGELQLGVVYFRRGDRRHVPVIQIRGDGGALTKAMHGPGVRLVILRPNRKYLALTSASVAWVCARWGITVSELDAAVRLYRADWDAAAYTPKGVRRRKREDIGLPFPPVYRLWAPDGRRAAYRYGGLADGG